MDEREDWERFTLTGKVEDYLKYAARTKEQETGSYAGFADSNRTHIESGTDRGI